jgi:hypothetical protein
MMNQLMCASCSIFLSHFNKALKWLSSILKDKLVFVSRGTQNDQKYFYVHPETGAVIQIGDLTELPEKTQITVFQVCDFIFSCNNLLSVIFWISSTQM